MGTDCFNLGNILGYLFLAILNGFAIWILIRETIWTTWMRRLQIKEHNKARQVCVHCGEITPWEIKK